ncbi:MAG: esterase family protein [Bacteroidaceae bacterium]|nr:esterase family protein [Bacteroidaceae bacterium]
MEKKLLTVLITLLCSLTSQAGRVVTDSIQSTILGATVRYNVYLPSGFENGTKQYPVVYLLHGFTDDYTAWRDKGQMQTVADELIETGEACEMVIVMPNAGGPNVMDTWNGYFNMPGWNYEDFFYQELIPTAEQKYRCIGDKAHRAIMGLSMGGGGSTVYAQRHTDMYSSCYAMSAWLDSDGGQQRQEGVDDKVYLVSQAVKNRSALNYVSNADNATVEQLRTVRWFIDCGDDDFLFDQNVQLHQLMRQKRIKSELRIRNGQHNWEYWHTAIRLALPFVSQGFSSNK